MLAESHASVYQIDIFNKSLGTQHRDNVHLDTELYYKPFSALFFELVKASEVDRE